MRAVALFIVVVGTSGCEGSRPYIRQEPGEVMASMGFVTLSRLATDLSLKYRGEGDGFLELSAAPDNVLLAVDSRRALVNGRKVAMDGPCVRRGSDFVVTERDAAKVRQVLADLRATRAERHLHTAPERPVAPERPTSVQPRRGNRLPNLRPRAPTRAWQYIVIHHAVVMKGSASLLDKIHRRRLYDGLGYHFVIGNGSDTGDGEIEIGYRWRDQVHGAHTRARAGDDNRWNRRGIGICLMGDFTKRPPSSRQLGQLVELVRELQRRYDIPLKNVVPHRFVTPTICPGPLFPWNEFQRRLRR